VKKRQGKREEMVVWEERGLVEGQSEQVQSEWVESQSGWV
jgi:hypothetical protein